MSVMSMAALSLLAGFIAAGTVWYIWGVAENLMAMRRAKAQAGKASSEDEGK